MSTAFSSPVLCRWRVVAPRGHRIGVNVTKFNLPQSLNCDTGDYVELRDGHFVLSPLIGKEEEHGL